MNLIPDRPAAGQTWCSRRHVPIDTVVIHVMEGTFEGTLDWFQTPDRDANGTPQNAPHAAAHYCIAKDGRVCRTVAEMFCAYHAGNLRTNLCSIGIELEGVTRNLDMPEAQMAALAELVKQLCIQYGIKMDRAHIIGHDEVPDPLNPGLRGGLGHHTDPGLGFKWDDLMSRLTSEVA